VSFGVASVIPWRAGQSAGAAPAGEARDISLMNFIIAVAAVTVLTVYGLLQFRGHVAAQAGTDFGRLDVTTVRRLQTTGLAQTGSGGGLGVLLVSLAPLLGALGIYGGMRLHKAWLLLLPVGFLVTTQSPARTGTLGLVVTCAVFYLYMRPKNSEQRTPVTKLRVAALLVVVAALGISYFQVVGGLLGKSRGAEQYFSGTTVPPEVITPFLYVAGGVSALSVTQTYHDDPVAGRHGRSLYLLTRIAEPFGLAKTPPSTLADYTSVPVPTNVYSAFGDVWYEFGRSGVVLVFGVFGLLCSAAHRRARDRDPAAMWVSAILMSVLASTPLALRLLYLDTVLQIVVGVVAFRLVEARFERAGLHAKVSRADPLAGSATLGGSRALRLGVRPQE
jgi:oligosaccharide repeat unit polymerase